MAKLVGADWVAEHLESREIAIVDPRRPMKYLLGHLPGAINIPMYRAFGADGRLLAPDALAAFIGGAGLGDGVTPILYDSPEGQNAAMLAWMLEYLGRADVLVMDAFYEYWKAAGREVRYRPVAAAARQFTARVNPSVRITLAELRAAEHCKLIDFRSREEFAGEKTVGSDPPGHIPGAVNLVWRDLASPPERILAPAEKIAPMLDEAGVKRGDQVVAYCRSGPRAALGYLALAQLGYEVRLFDGSWAEWTSVGLPAEK
ncbi:MAG: sulfurtransferase [Candidatus Binataceae bacterium]|nr:sulfurtransferase [Candidatus Binataceae bacterium]